MLKKLNILCEEIKNEIAKDFRFSRSSRFLNYTLSAEEKSKLNEEYNKIVKDELEAAAKSGETIKIYYLKEDGWGGKIPNCTIDKVFEKDGIWYCSWFKPGYETAKRNLDEEWNSEDHKHYVEMARLTPEEDEKRKQERLKDYNPTLPIANITTDKILDLMIEKEEEIKEDWKKKKEEAITNIKNILPNEIKYLLEKEYIKVDQLITKISSLKEADEEISFSNKSIFEDEKALSIFKVDNNSKEFKEAIKDSKKDGEQWYYGGGTSLYLIIKLHVNKGEIYDVNRMKNFEYSHTYKRSGGHNTVGDF